MNKAYYDSNHWGQIPIHDFENIVPKPAYISPETCRKVIDHLKMPIRLFDVGENQEWEDWAIETMHGTLTAEMISLLRTSNNKGYKFGNIAPFIAWGWVWHRKYVDATSFMCQLGSMYYNTKETEDNLDSIGLINYACGYLDAVELVRYICTLHIAASLTLADMLPAPVFWESILWSRSPALGDHLKPSLSVKGIQSFSSITPDETQSPKGFLVALNRDLIKLIACTCSYLLAQELKPQTGLNYQDQLNTQIECDTELALRTLNFFYSQVAK